MTDALRTEVAHYLTRCVREGECLVRPDVVGYGEIRADGKRIGAHRAVFLAGGGELADGQVVRHSCDRVGCVERTHLASGSISQNMRDIYDRDRRRAPWRHGETHPSAQLTAGVVKALRQAAHAGAGLRALARDSGLTYSTVRNAVVGVTWAHITDPTPLPSKRGHTNPSRQLVNRRPDDAREARRLAAGGASCAEIAKALGVSRHTAWKLTREIAS